MCEAVQNVHNSYGTPEWKQEWLCVFCRQNVLGHGKIYMRS